VEFPLLITLIVFCTDLKPPAWDALDYSPEKAISPNDCSTEEAKDEAILRQVINYEHVRKELSSKTLSTADIDIFEVDAVVVGSGSGGGIMAGQLVEAGYTVLVVEKGGYFQSKDYKEWREAESMANLYDKGGLCTSEDGGVVILSGSCIGGGSTLNWSASFRTPDIVLEDWEKTGLTQFK
jgi:hypothetical protein